MSTTIAFQPPNRIGIGHINRLAAIALSIKQCDQSIQLPFVIEGGGHQFLDALGLPYLGLPSLFSMYQTDRWQAWTTDGRHEVEMEISRAIIKALKPRIVVFDLLPNPAFASAALENDAALVLCLREMKNSDEYFDRIAPLIPHISLVLVPHEVGVVTIPATLELRTVFVGDVLRPPSRVASAPPFLKAPNVVIVGGGGGHPETVEFYNLTLRALANIRKGNRNLECLLVTGPLFADWQRLEPAEGVTIVPFDISVRDLMQTADLTICQGGYNTVAELRYCGTPTICVPAQRKYDDQFIRAERFASQRSNSRVFRGSDVSELTVMILECLRLGKVSVPEVAPSGAMKAASALLKLCSQKTAHQI